MKTFNVIYKPTGELVLDASARERDLRLRALRKIWEGREKQQRFFSSSAPVLFRRDVTETHAS